MPSGSKKRKAAKKKKENQSNNRPDNPSPASTHSHGGDDVRTQDDKESDVGEVSSPASQDHHSHQNLSREGEEEEIEGVDNMANVPSAEGVKIEVVGDPNIVVEESVVPVEREFKIEDKSDKKDVKHDETAKKSNEGASSGSSSSGSSSSSDDESHDIKSSQAVADFAPVVDSVKVADSLSGGQAEAIHSAKIEKADDPVMENIPAFVSEKIPLLGAEPQLDMSSSAGNSAAPSVVESVLKENGVKKLVSFEDEVGTSAVSEVAASQRKEEAIIPPVENNVTIPDQKECIVVQETDDRLRLSYNAPIATADNGGDRENESGVIEPLLAPAPQRVQTTSWKSCCGLFEVFTRSGR